MSWQRKFLDSFGILKDMFLDFLRSPHSYTLGFIVVCLFSFLFELAGWWYLMLLAGGLAGFLIKRPGHWCFLLGFCGTALIWIGFFAYFMTIGPLTELTSLISSIMGIFETFPNALILITIFIGGLLGGLGALNGTYIAKIVYPPKKTHPIQKSSKKEKNI
ncbi:MAG: hypothetical protein ACTSRS_13635 [Candidatus Helarchaeota archaeon]